ncbi:unnamed protein product [Linum tenue]|uniref:Amino acid transporter transmembrane domain-containing protein n=1 Tax=Linum tenue TaxID=586396 RepID=A0AAV0JD74_9ROSI|nr:unnamed protein product [Linum tenue]
MPVFDNLELRFVSLKNKPCSRLVRVCLRLFFGGLTFFIAVAFPFLPSLALVIGAVALPVTLAYPCLMWISMKKKQNKESAQRRIQGRATLGPGPALSLEEAI